jgi:hypothetical protein
MDVASSTSDFQLILKSHRSYLASILRLTYIDNAVVQEAIDRVLQVCLRFLIVASILRENEELAKDKTSRVVAEGHIFIPLEELQSIKSEFMTQLSFLCQLLKTMDNKGLIFRLDFNDFVSMLSVA